MRFSVFQDSLPNVQQMIRPIEGNTVPNADSLGQNQILADSLKTQDSITIETNKGNSDEVSSSLFNSVVESSGKLNPTERPVLGADWITIHFIICLGLIAWVQVYYRKRLGQILKAFTAGHFLNQLEREGNLFKERIIVPLIIVFLVTFSTLLYLAMTMFFNLTPLDLSGFKLFSLIIVIVLALWFLKNILITIIGNVFKNYLLLTDYLLINLVTNIATGIFLLPIVIIAVYTSSVFLVYSGLVLWGLIFIFRIVRELLAVLSYSKFSLFPRILYLCTFEIVPLLVLTKLVMSYLT
ncbi:MAG: DUF4271 domain-containing protein [Bacteroidales bacterium]|nr:DUF4271 domain-containing protein [Bacteroidales bacterium]